MDNELVLLLISSIGEYGQFIVKFGVYIVLLWMFFNSTKFVIAKLSSTMHFAYLVKDGRTYYVSYNTFVSGLPEVDFTLTRFELLSQFLDSNIHNRILVSDNDNNILTVSITDSCDMYLNKSFLPPHRTSVTRQVYTSPLVYIIVIQSFLSLNLDKVNVIITIVLTFAYLGILPLELLLSNIFKKKTIVKDEA